MTSKPKKVLNRIHWPGTLAVAGQLVTVLQSPLVLDNLSKEWSAVLVAIFAAVQAITKAVHTKGKE